MFNFFKKVDKPSKSEPSINENKQNLNLSLSYDKNIHLIKEILSSNDTIIYREITPSDDNSIRICAIFDKSLADKESISENIIHPILRTSIDKLKNNNAIDQLAYKILKSGNITKSFNLDKIIGSILYGETALLVEGYEEALIIDAKGWSIRTVSEPTTEKIVRGSKESFTESVLVNVSLIRRRITNSDLKFQFKELGKITKTKICICYIENIASPKIIDELYKRIADINIDGILESGYVEELIRDAPLSPFATIGNTERPDSVAANLLEGKVALLVDGTPFVLTVPYLFMEYFQSPEDYYSGFLYGSINRILRYVAFFLSTSIPAIYVALVTYHHEMIPTPLILSIAAAREGVPFPTIVEAFIMLFAFELMREGGVRLPTPIGTTISFVGAVILGEAAVTAKIVSAPIVIIVALTGISNFLIPGMIGALNIIRVMFLILSSFIGLYGYIFGVIGLFIHLVSIRSFGIPYMLNLGSLQTQDIKDTAIRAPWWIMNYRPKLISEINKVRERKK